MMLVLGAPVEGLEALVAGARARMEAERVEVDVTVMRDVRAAVEAHRPHAVVLPVWRDAAAAEADPDRAFRLSSEAAINLVAAALEFRARPCLLSVADVFGLPGGPFRPPDPPQPVSQLAEAAARAELFATRASKGSAMVVRSGPWIEALEVALRAGAPLPRGVRVSPIRARDLGLALVQWLEAERTGILHAATPGPGVEVEELARRLGANLGVGRPRFEPDTLWAPSAVLDPSEPPLPAWDRPEAEVASPASATAPAERSVEGETASPAVRMDGVEPYVLQLQPGTPWLLPKPGILRVEEGKAVLERPDAEDTVVQAGDARALTQGRLLPVSFFRAAFSAGVPPR
jgi:dTDP-4-dehydrorhamnose reductase